MFIASRRALFGGGRIGPSISLCDFTAGLPSQFSLTRSGTRYARDATGAWQAYASNTARLHYDVLGAPLGVVFERSYTDKCVLGTNLAAAPTDTSGSFFTTPTNVSRITSLGLSGGGWESLITSALRIDNSAGGSSLLHQIKNTTGNTNKHCMQMLTRDYSGAGATTSGMQLTGGSVVAVSAFGSWELITSENLTPSSSVRLSQIVTRANRTQDVALLLLTESIYCPLPYLHPTDNAAVILNNEWASAPLTSFPIWNLSEAAIGFEWYHEWPFTVDNEPIFSIAKSSSPTTDYLRIVGMADGSIKVELVIGSSSIFLMTFSAPTRRTICRAVIRLKSGSFLAAVNGAGGAVNTNTGSWGALDTVYINRLDTGYSNAIVRSLEFSKNHLSDSQVVAASAPNDGGFI